jgi:hypothetical protein
LPKTGSARAGVEQHDLAVLPTLPVNVGQPWTGMDEVPKELQIMGIYLNAVPTTERSGPRSIKYGGGRGIRTGRGNPRGYWLFLVFHRNLSDFISMLVQIPLQFCHPMPFTSKYHVNLPCHKVLITKELWTVSVFWIILSTTAFKSSLGKRKTMRYFTTKTDAAGNITVFDGMTGKRAGKRFERSVVKLMQETDAEYRKRMRRKRAA